MGFKGTLQQFFDYMRTSPKFQPKTREELEQGFASVKAKVEAKVPQYLLAGAQDGARDPALSAVSREVRGRRQL